MAWSMRQVCVHNSVVPVSAFDGFPDDLAVTDIGHAARCTACGQRGGASAYPHHRLWVAHLRQTGQRHRLPYWVRERGRGGAGGFRGNGARDSEAVTGVASF
jgi:hypothetical protein